MVYLNSASRSRNTGSLINQSQGGGDKKAGLPYQIGREYYTSILLHSSDPVNGSCCTLKDRMTMRFTPSRFVARPIGSYVGVAHGYYGKF